MDLATTYTSLKGDDIEVYEGLIEAKELQIGDELYLALGQFHLVGKVVVEISESTANAEVDLSLVYPPTQLGRHAIVNATMDGRQSYTGTKRMKPFPMGDRFNKALEKQNISLDEDILAKLSNSRVRKGYPKVVRRK